MRAKVAKQHKKYSVRKQKTLDYNDLDEKAINILKIDKGRLSHEPQYEKIKVFWNKEKNSPF